MMFVRALACLCLAALLLTAGCGSPGPDFDKEKLEKMTGGDIKDTIPVSGTVSVDGAPSANVHMSAYTEGGATPVGTARSGENGAYCWTTYTTCDGLPAGEYKIAFKYIPYEGKGKDEGEDVLNGRYRDPSKSEFTLSVKSGAPQIDVKYDLATK